MRLNTDRAIDVARLDRGGRAATYSEEASTLEFGGPYRLFDDAADYGVWVRGGAGTFAPFVLIEVQRDREGDIQAWRFSCADLSRPMSLLIWND